MTLNAPKPLDKSHQIDAFDCGKSSMNQWLVRHALQAQSSGSARTFVVTHQNLVVAYYSLTVGQVEPFDVPTRIQKGMGRHPIPVMVLARLAVSNQYQGMGIARGQLQDAIKRTLTVSEHTGIRAILTHPIDIQASGFYQRFGFIPSPLKEAQLLLLLKDAKKVLSGN